MENQKTKIISIASIIALALTLVTATFAYFMAQTGEGKSTDIKINANTVDTFTFEAGSAINLNINQDNFASGAGNQSGTTFAKAMLTANNKTNTATEHYYMYLNISENTFTYTQDENAPEILLTIKDESNNEITSINGLIYKTVTDGKGASISGFDITTKSGLITLFDNREITTTSSKTEKWNITLTYVNYNENQSANAGKSFNSNVMIQKEIIPSALSDICTSGNNLTTCITTLANNSKSDYTKIYHHTSTLTNGARDNSYRYAGANNSVKNYICLGSTETTCPEENLYRIIGVFGDQVKVIRAKTESNQYWDTNGSNTWSTSSLNTYLNGTYLTSLGTLADKIAITAYKVGGSTSANLLFSPPATVYLNEVGSSASSTTHNAKIGLMYMSDYYYGASPSAWTLVGLNENDPTKDYSAATTMNWLYSGSEEWTITRYTQSARRAFRVHSDGFLGNPTVNEFNLAVRPVFNLESSTTYVSGSGTVIDSIVIN